MITRYFSFKLPVRRTPEGLPYMTFLRYGFYMQAYPWDGTYYWSIKVHRDPSVALTSSYVISPRHSRMKDNDLVILHMGQDDDFDSVYNTFMLFIEPFSIHKGKLSEAKKVYDTQAGAVQREKNREAYVRQVFEQQNVAWKERTPETVSKG